MSHSQSPVVEYRTLPAGTMLTFTTGSGNEVEVELLEGTSPHLPGARPAKIHKSPPPYIFNDSVYPTCIFAVAPGVTHAAINGHRFTALPAITTNAVVVLADTDAEGHHDTSHFTMTRVVVSEPGREA